MDAQPPIRTLSKNEFPPLLREIHDPPKRLFIRGSDINQSYIYLAVVGSRRYSHYGKDVCEKLIHGLAGYPICIVSGLALGIDAVAHESAIRAGLPTIALPGSGIDGRVLYPRAHTGLARTILSHGGALLSEYEPMHEAAPWCFPARNRIMAGMSHAVLVIEARERSGTLITARLAMECGRDVLVVPAPIFSLHGIGSNQLLREGAQVVTSSKDILQALGITPDETTGAPLQTNLSDDERMLIKLLEEPQPLDELVRRSELPVFRTQTLISALEIKGYVVERLGMIERVQ